MNFVPSALLLIFSATFFAVWRRERTRRYLLLFALAFGSTGLAIFLQLAHIPADFGYNALVSALLYSGGVLLLGEGVLARSGERLPRAFHLSSLLAVVAAIGYFYYVERNLTARVYVLNFGMGGMLL